MYSKSATLTLQFSLFLVKSSSGNSETFSMDRAVQPKNRMRGAAEMKPNTCRCESATIEQTLSEKRKSLAISAFSGSKTMTIKSGRNI